ncbi:MULTISPECIES: hypothetical protein [unclassified Oceanispirochaeta]|uniref:hypothetical protein n=1 Tax=unclassified Oceanispirochaeta TaxID=2635722 RepID=UPI000E096EE1|nr:MULTISPECIES: hypothetical protein [unclassified Oceanispirochaeta]MBF9018753.1 hypothetical protein [Oceanispirochaeta sp. M2]NPD75191.1 hypothetical protein [Oceanispirochaeta sp. M1]RDG28974.1 hypothetical protein DV872_24150 [Oceanispirochaeta sp. M1]
MKKNALLIILLLVFILSCTTEDSITDSPFYHSDDIIIPKVPTPISGNYENLSGRIIGRSSITQEQITAYDQFIIIHEDTNNFNNNVDEHFQKMIDDAKALSDTIDGEWIEIDDPIFTHEIIISNYNNGTIIRSNDNYTQIEVIISSPDGNESQLYLQIKETEDFTHTICIFPNLDDSDSSASIEIIETNDFTYTKCIRNISVPTGMAIQHFVGITDKSSADNKTVGRVMIEEVELGYEFSFEPGDFLDTDYFSQDNEDWPRGEGFELYGFFNDTDYYLVTNDAASRISEGYVDPQKLKFIYSNGINNQSIGSLAFDAFDEPTGIVITDWVFEPLQ